jgi:hypothetical protein
MKKVLLILLSAGGLLYSVSWIQSSDKSKQPPAKPADLVAKEVAEPVKGGPANSVIVPYQLESTQNTFNISQFKDMALPDNHKAVLGFGSPAFIEWSRSEPLEIYKKGFTHFSNSNAFTAAQAPARTQHWFVGFTDLLKEVAIELAPKYPDAINVTSSNWSAVSEKTAIEMGKRCWQRRGIGYDYPAKTYNRKSDYGYFLLDEEQFPGGVNAFLGNVLKGWRMENATCIINLYGKAFNFFYLANLTSYPHKFTQSDILNIRELRSFAFNFHSYAQARATLEVSGGYFKVPVIKSSIYQKNGGKYVLDASGKRLLRRDNFTEEIFGRKFRMLNQPDPQLQKHSQIPDKKDWKTDVEWMLQELYLYQDYLTIASLNFAKSEFNDFDISKWRPYGKKKAITFRPRTEPWTYGGNEYKIRETGEYAILYQVLFAFFNGVDYVESWDNGWAGEPLAYVGQGRQDIKHVGEKLYPVPGYSWDKPKDYWNNTEDASYNDNIAGDDNYSRYVVYTAAVQTFAKVCRDNQYKFDQTLRYIRFNPPVNTFRNKEILASGIYQGDKLSLVMMYPYHDETDKTNIELKVGDKVINFTLSSRKPAVFSWTVPKSIDPRQITIRYVNIDGQQRKIRGFVDGDKNNTYIE